jgi:glycosyltransferase involved in cell wall biosynthesis
MRIATFLPHVGVFGGVRRFLELGNAWSASGHEVTLYHPEGVAPGWLPYRGRVAQLEAAASESSDLAFCADRYTFDAFAGHRAGTHVYYAVAHDDPGVGRAATTPGMRLAANSGELRSRIARTTGRAVLDGIGGISTRQFHPDPSQRPAGAIRVLLNGRRSRPKKGTDLVLRALDGIRSTAPLEIVLFDSISEQNRQDPRDGARLPAGARFVLGPTQDELVTLYQSAHVFVAAERKAGWCNTALEAMACGAAVICTDSGTTDFARDGENALRVRWRHPLFFRRAIRRLLADDALRDRIAAAGPPTAARWTWEMLAAKLLAQLGGTTAAAHENGGLEARRVGSPDA